MKSDVYDWSFSFINSQNKLPVYDYAHTNPEFRGSHRTFDARKHDHNHVEHVHKPHSHAELDEGETQVVKKLRRGQLRNRIDSVECTCGDY